jgi:predicted lactoylglutathione lyase
VRDKLRVFKFVKAKWFIFVAGLILGALILLVVRFATYNPVRVHYHANFAVYLNGQREEFQGPQYYQEVAICSATNDITIPQQRAHMHDNINSVVHVHDHAVTWGQFFENLGWYVGPNFIETDDGTMYIENGNNKLHVIINGQDYTDLTPITNTLIKDKSRLLLSFGDLTDQQIQQEYQTVPSTAAHYDVTKDPASCAGTEQVTTTDRLHHLF